MLSAVVTFLCFIMMKATWGKGFPLACGSEGESIIAGKAWHGGGSRKGLSHSTCERNRK